MLRRFLAENFDELVSRTRARAAAWRSPSTAAPALEPDVPLLLAQLRGALRSDPSRASDAAAADDGAGPATVRCARAVLERSWTVSKLVQDYGHLREVIVELAAEQGRAVSPEEAEVLSRGLHLAIADAVVADARLKDEATSHREIERLGQVGHDLRNQLQTALLSFRALRTGKADIGAAAGDALGRSLVRLGDLIETRLAAVGLAATSRVSLAAFVHEVAVAARGDAVRREVRLAIEPGDPALAVDVDPQLLAFALKSLLQNAFESTRAHGTVTLRARGEHGRAFVEVEDECGGMGTGGGERCRVAGDRRGTARVAPTQGLSSCRRAAQSNGGEVHVHNLPGKGCIFGIELPLAAAVDAGR